eukprot:6818155-Prymnesium_polylepis.1
MKPAFGTIQYVSDDGNYNIRLEDGTRWPRACPRGLCTRCIHTPVPGESRTCPTSSSSEQPAAAELPSSSR